MTDDELSDDDQLLAAELALGLIDEGERQEAGYRLASDPAFEGAYQQWLRRASLLPVDSDVPRPSLWSDIAASLPTQAANDAAAAPGSSARWKVAAVAASVVAMLLGAMLLSRVATPTPPPATVASASPPLIAVLTGAKERAIVAISFDGRTRRLSIVPIDLKVSGHSAELWAIPVDQQPRSLGILADREGSSRTAPSSTAIFLRPGTVLAISIEPQGGSATGKPTGPVILTGKIVNT